MRHPSSPIVSVRAQLAAHRHFRERILADIPDLDEETLSDTLEGLTNLREMIVAVVRSVLIDEAMVLGLSTRVAEMKARMERIEARARRKRQLVCEAMSEGDIRKLIEPEFTASLRQSPPTVEIISEDKIPAAYWKPQPPRLDRQGLLAALKGGSLVDGVSIASPSTQLSIRTK